MVEDVWDLLLQNHLQNMYKTVQNLEHNFGHNSFPIPIYGGV